jgi:threonine dehydratase
VVWCHHFGAWLKLECLQVTGSYKVRGALNALLRARALGDDRPVVVASAGNHGQGAAWAAARVGVKITVVMPHGAPRTKVEGCARLGAEVILDGGSFDVAEGHAERLATRRGWRFLHPFDDPDVIAGQGTVGVELQDLDVDTVLVPVGGGGLVSGIGLALADRGMDVVGVQVTGVQAFHDALNGMPNTGETAPTIADGVRVSRPGGLTTAVAAKTVAAMTLVSDNEVRAAMAGLLTRSRVISEGAGAVAVAALSRFEGRRAVAIVSGGNVDPEVLAAVAAQPVGL